MTEVGRVVGYGTVRRRDVGIQGLNGELLMLFGFEVPTIEWAARGTKSTICSVSANEERNDASRRGRSDAIGRIVPTSEDGVQSRRIQKEATY